MHTVYKLDAHNKGDPIEVHTVYKPDAHNEGDPIEVHTLHEARSRGNISYVTWQYELGHVTIRTGSRGNTNYVTW